MQHTYVKKNTCIPRTLLSKELIMITLDEIRKRIVETIKQSGLTQTEIAKKLNIGQQVISEYVRGKSLPALDTLANLCRILDVDANYILCLVD